MGNPLIKAGSVLIKGGKFAVKHIVSDDVMKLGAKIGNNFIEKHKSLVKIPDLKDVHIDEAIRILKEELNLIPAPAIAKPRLAYANESENEVMYSEPKFGSRVDPKTAVKVYYLTQEVIAKSKELLEKQVQEFGIPRVVGLNIDEAQEDLESLGLKVTRKLEKPDLKFVNKEDRQVTRVTYPDNKKTGAKFKTGDRVWLYFVNEEVIVLCNAMKDKKVRDGQERIDKIKKAANNMKNDICAGAVDNAQKVAGKIGESFAKKKASSDKSEE